MWRHPDGTFRQSLPPKVMMAGAVHAAKDLTVDQLDGLGFNEAVPAARQPHTVYTTEWVKDGLVCRERIVTAVVDEAGRDAALADSIRAGRDRLLAGCDWTQLADAPLSEDEREAWCAYRQELRDMPQQPGFPGAAEWPQEPDATV